MIGNPRLHGTHSGEIPEGPNAGGGTSSGWAGVCGSDGAVPVEPPGSNLAAYRCKPRKPVAGNMSTERMPTAMTSISIIGMSFRNNLQALHMRDHPAILRLILPLHLV